MKNGGKINLVLMVSALLLSLKPVLAAVPMPAQADIDKATAEIKSNDDAQVAAAIKQIRVWLDGGRPVRNVWTEWGPDLMKENRNQDAADLLLDECVQRADTTAIVPCLEMRTNALLAAGKNDEALAAAKSYYNVCDMKYTARAVDLVALCLARTHPDDGEIVRRWRNEQATASTATPAPTTTSSDPATSRPAGMLSAVVIDTKLWEGGLKTWSAKTTPFASRVSYGDLLLAADKGAEAEKLFRELYQLAGNQADLATAIEGIAKALRAEDGNVGRANAYLASLQKAPPGQ